MDQLTEWFQTVIYEYNSYSIIVSELLSFGLFLAILIILYRILFNRYLQFYLSYQNIGDEIASGLKRKIRIVYLIFTLIGAVRILNLDFNILSDLAYMLEFSTVLLVILFVFIARLLDYIFNKVILSNYYEKREEKVTKRNKQDEDEDEEAKPTSTLQIAVYIIVGIMMLQYFNWDIQLFEIPTNTTEPPISINITNILIGILIVILARIVSWTITKLFLFRYYKRKEIDKGTQFAVNQLIKYIIYVLAFVFVIQSLGLKLTVILGGAAALLVGIGLGLQQTFNDLISGIIILFERSVEVGDVVEIDMMTGVVRKIGLRTSRIETRDNINVIVPNSKLTVNNMINWSHFDDKARFDLAVGVEYGSDTEKVRKILLQVAKSNPYVLEYPSPMVQFSNFSDSALSFELKFWSRNFMLIEAIKSDLRFEVEKAFRENDVVFPFPQRDIWIRNSEDFMSSEAEE